MKSSPQKDIVIASLEFAREKLMKGEIFDRGHLSNFLLYNGYMTPEEVGKNDNIIGALYSQIMSYQDPNNSLVKVMGLDSYLGLLDYEELQLAREDSARAREEAKLAIQHAAEATRLTKQALFWTKVSVIAAIIVGVVQIVISFQDN